MSAPPARIAAAVALAEHIAEMMIDGITDCPCCGGLSFSASKHKWIGEHDNDPEDYVCPVGVYLRARDAWMRSVVQPRAEGPADG